MKAYVLRTYGEPLVPEDLADPLPGPTDVIVRVRACGICGTDLKIVSGALSSIVRLPHVPGHEIAGEIVSLGSEVRGLSAGDRGTVHAYLTCGECAPCRAGRQNICTTVKRLGFELAGGFAEYVKLPARNFCKTDSGLPFEQLAVLPDALLTSYHSVMTVGGLRGGEKVLIAGAGGLGIHALQFARFSGAEVAVCDPKPDARELAAKFGASLLLPDLSKDSLEQLADWTGGCGVDLVIEGSGNGDIFASSLAALGRGGRLVIMGYHTSIPHRLDSMAMHYNEWSVTGSRLGTVPELRQVMELVEGGAIRPVIAKTMPMAEVNAGLAELASGRAPGRIVLTAG